MEKIIEHQVSIQIKEQGLLKGDFTDLEYLKLLYRMAIKLLEELK